MWACLSASAIKVFGWCLRVKGMVSSGLSGDPGVDESGRTASAGLLEERGRESGPEGNVTRQVKSHPC